MCRAPAALSFSTYDAVNDWQSHGSPTARSLAVGDRFGAVATEVLIVIR